MKAGQMKVLIVEDDAIIAMDLSETLEEAGYDVVAIAPTYELAMDAVKQHTPDIALVDIWLENSTKNGIETATRMVRHHRMPIIYLTANSEQQTFLTAKKTFPAAYLLKPFRADELKFQLEMAYHNFQSGLSNSVVDTTDSVFLPIEKGYKKLKLDQVQFMQAKGSYTDVYEFKRKAPYLICTNLGNLMQYFVNPEFYRLSRSMVINVHQLERLEGDYLYMMESAVPIRIPISSRKELLKKIKVIKTK